MSDHEIRNQSFENLDRCIARAVSLIAESYSPDTVANLCKILDQLEKGRVTLHSLPYWSFRKTTTSRSSHDAIIEEEAITPAQQQVNTTAASNSAAHLAQLQTAQLQTANATLAASNVALQVQVQTQIDQMKQLAELVMLSNAAKSVPVTPEGS